MASHTEVAAMRRALSLAATPGVPPGPNPRVGCVLLAADGSIVAEGYHRGAGTPHAEVDALSHVADATGTTAVVTLEPCTHTGRTGPCAQALLAAGVHRVVFAQPDTSPTAAGGAALLRAGGVDVESDVLRPEAERLNEEWTLALALRRPFVTWKAAATLDGRVAAADGTSRWITSEQARADVHEWRARCDVVLVGTGTALVDDPHLTARRPDGEPCPTQPRRAVMGLRSLPADARLRAPGADTVHLRTRDPHEALAILYGQDVQHVYLEGGPTVAAAFVAADLVDRVVLYLAGRLLGEGSHLLGSIGVHTLADAPRLTITDVSRIGPDVRLVARRLRAHEE